MNMHERYLETVQGHPVTLNNELPASELYFKNNLISLRNIIGLNRKDLVRIMRVEQSYYYNLESNNHTSPTFEWLEIIADFYGIEVYMLFVPDLVTQLSPDSRQNIIKWVTENYL